MKTKIGTFEEVYIASAKDLFEENLNFDLRFGVTPAVPKNKQVDITQIEDQIQKSVFASRLPTQVVIEVNDHLARDLIEYIKGKTKFNNFTLDLIDKFKLQDPSNELLVDYDKKESKINQLIRDEVVKHVQTKLEENAIPYLTIFSGGSSYHIHIFFKLPSYIIERIKEANLLIKSFKPKNTSFREWGGRFSLPQILFLWVLKRTGLFRDFMVKEVGISKNLFIDSALLSSVGMFPLPNKQRLDKPLPTKLTQEYPVDNQYKYIIPLYLKEDFEELFDLFTITNNSSTSDSTTKPHVTDLILLKNEILSDIPIGCLAIKNSNLLIPIGNRDVDSGKLYFYLRMKGLHHKVIMDILEKIIEKDEETASLLVKTNTRRKIEFDERYIYTNTPDLKYLEESIFTPAFLKRIDILGENFYNFLQNIISIKKYHGLSKDIVSLSIVFKGADDEIFEEELYSLSTKDILNAVLNGYSTYLRTANKADIDIKEGLNINVWYSNLDEKYQLKRAKERLMVFTNNLIYLTTMRFNCEEVPMEDVYIYDEMLRSISTRVGMDLYSFMVDNEITDPSDEQVKKMKYQLIYPYANKEQLITLMKSLINLSSLPHSKLNEYISGFIRIKRLIDPNTKSIKTTVLFREEAFKTIVNKVDEYIQELLPEIKNMIEKNKLVKRSNEPTGQPPDIDGELEILKDEYAEENTKEEEEKKLREIYKNAGLDPDKLLHDEEGE